MLSWLLESFFVLAIVQVALAGTVYPCGQQRVIYEGSPDYGWDSLDSGYVSRYNGQYTTSTLCKINFPSSAAGKTCKLSFNVGPSGWVDPNGSKRGQIFTIGSADYATATFNNRGPAHRDNQLATFKDVIINAPAGFEGGNTFPCPTGWKGFEVVPTWDNTYIYWTGAGYGLSVEVL